MRTNCEHLQGIRSLDQDASVTQGRFFIVPT